MDAVLSRLPVPRKVNAAAQGRRGGASLQHTQDRGGAKGKNCTASTARIPSRRDARLAALAYTQHYQTLLQELQGYSEDTAESPAVEQSESGERADTYQQECTLLREVACQCKTGIQYLGHPAYHDEVMYYREE